MKHMSVGKCMTLVLLVSLVLGSVLIAEAQRRQPMMGPQQDQEFDERSRGPMMMGERSMMCPGMGMGPGMMSGYGTMGPGMMSGHGMMGPGMGMGMMALYHLDLTEEQHGEIRSVQREARRRHMEIIPDLMDIHDDLVDVMAEDRPDPEKVRALQEAMSKKQGEMLESAIEYRNRIYDLLTEEQQEQLRDVQQQPFE